MKEEVLISIEVGSTFTKLAGFAEHHGALRYLGRAEARTAPPGQDVGTVADQLINKAPFLRDRGWDSAVLSSSAAGGLRIAVSGLTPTLSTKVATEVSLGAGGIVVHSVSGRVRPQDTKAMAAREAGLVLVCGGTDGGEASTVLANARTLADSPIDALFVFAGNEHVQDEAMDIFGSYGKRCVAAANVYPGDDRYQFEEVRELIRESFDRDVVKAPGVDALAARLQTPCLPTPLAVSRAVELFGQHFDGLVAIDVGGATTDIHSYTPPPSGRRTVHAAFEPQLKRSVEGDLGLFHNLANLVQPGEQPLELGEPPLAADVVGTYAMRAAQKGLERHCGTNVPVFGAWSPHVVVNGADLSSVSAVLATGGALRHSMRNPTDLQMVLESLTDRCLVPRTVRHWLVDHSYLASSLGALRGEHEDSVSRFVEQVTEEGLWHTERRLP
ncbi:MULTISPECIES: glutamate mutase L [unclassified Streptomyces]|uniref:glutamate mutase L n=1 Tax=Streptomyces sp. NPDC127532 TaxID=3345399 RepID=UPI003637126F